MIEKLDKQIHEFYNNKFLRNRYPSLSYVSSGHDFVDGDSPDIAAVALGYKPAALIDANVIKKPVNDYYLTKCYYQGFELLYLDEENVVVCNRCDFDSFREIFGKTYKHREWGKLLGYPEHLIDSYAKCIQGRFYPLWDDYNSSAEEMAIRLCMEMD